jgi:predicted DNA-binding transcriptional regulator AlpA
MMKTPEKKIEPATYTRKQTAILLNTSITSLWRARGTDFPMPVALLGRQIGYLKDEVDRWLASRPRVVTK